MSRSARYAWQKEVVKSSLEPSYRVVAIALEQYMTADGTNAYPSKATLAADTSFSPRTVQTALASLVEAGFLVVEAKATRYRPTTYGAALRGEALCSPDSSSGEKPSVRQGRSRASFRGEVATAPDPKNRSLEQIPRARDSAQQNSKGKNKTALTEAEREELRAAYDKGT